MHVSPLWLSALALGPVLLVGAAALFAQKKTPQLTDEVVQSFESEQSSRPASNWNTLNNFPNAQCLLGPGVEPAGFSYFVWDWIVTGP